MSGSKIFLDTNAFIYFFEGREKIKTLVLEASEIYYSPISEVELLSAAHLNDAEIKQIKSFLLL